MQTASLMQINVPATHSLSFQFVDDFNLEYHQRYGFDRVHIFSGTIDGDTQRQGRFCGPKPNGNKPFDGSKVSLFLIDTKLNHSISET